MAGRVEADPRLIEEAVRAVPGVAFAEVHTGEGEGLLTLVLWQGTDAAECAYRIETALRDSFAVELRPSDIRVVGYASPRLEPPVSEPTEAVPAAPAEGGTPGAPELRIIELDGSGGTTWATEPVRPGEALPPPEPAFEETPQPPAPPAPRAAPPPTPVAPPATPLEERSIIASLEVARVVVAEAGDEVEVRVELRSGDRVYAGEASGPATTTRKHRCLCHATLRAAAAALPGVRFDLDQAAVVELPEAAVVVVVTRLDASGERRLTGASLAGRDVVNAFVRATLAALR